MHKQETSVRLQLFWLGCATIHIDGGNWNDDNCGRLFGYVCQKLPGAPPITVPPTLQAPGNCPAGMVES